MGVRLIMTLSPELIIIHSAHACSVVPDAYYYRTAKVGQTVKFPCPTKLVDDVNWKRLDSPLSEGDDDDEERYIYDILGGPLDPRFTVLDANHSRALVIRNVTVDDSAYYQCIEDGGFGNKHFYGLTVEGIFVLLSSILLTQLNSSLLTDGSRMAKRDTAHKNK